MSRGRTPRLVGVVLATAAVTSFSQAAIATPAEAAVTAATVTTPAGPGYTKVFGDEFDGTTVDTSKWNHRTDVKGLSAQRPGNVSVGGGAMTIHLRKEAYAGKAYTGGGLVSKQGFRYGYYETRARTSVGSGWHTSFWAMAGDGSNTYTPDRRTEIDGFEMDSHLPRQMTHNVHRWRSGEPGDVYASPIVSGFRDVGFDTSAAYHVYGFDWSETAVRFYIDGQLRHTANYSPGSGVHDYIKVWLTSIAILMHGSPGVDESKLPGAVQFDYFRYYVKDHYVDNDGPASYGYSESGIWSTSTLRGFTQENTSRWSDAVGASATWRPNLRAAGTHGVYVYRIVSPGSDTSSRIDVAHNGVTSSSTLNYNTGTTGWVKVGSWYFPSGTSGYVKLIRTNGNARADAVKFVRES